MIYVQHQALYIFTAFSQNVGLVTPTCEKAVKDVVLVALLDI